MTKTAWKTIATITTLTMLGTALLAVPAEAAKPSAPVKPSVKIAKPLATAQKSAKAVKVPTISAPKPPVKPAGKATVSPKTTVPAKAANAAAQAKWTWKVDGSTKTSSTPSMTKTGNDYQVSLKEFAKMLGIPVQIDPQTRTVFLGKMPEEKNIIATYKVGNLTKTLAETELRRYVDYISFYNSEYEQYKDDPAFLEDMARKYILLDWNATQASTTDRMNSYRRADVIVDDLKKQVDNGSSLAQKWSMLTITEPMFRRFVALEVMAIAREKSIIDDASLAKAYEQAVADDRYTVADVRHILISTVDPATGETKRTDDAALAKAKELIARINKGEKFADLAATDSEDPGSKNNGGLYANANISQWVEGFKQAAKTLPLNTLSEPVKTEYGYHLMIVDKRSTKMLAEVKDLLVDQLARENLVNRLDQGLDEIIVSIQSPKSYFKN